MKPREIRVELTSKDETKIEFVEDYEVKKTKLLILASPTMIGILIFNWLHHRNDD